MRLPLRGLEPRAGHSAKRQLHSCPEVYLRQSHMAHIIHGPKATCARFPSGVSAVKTSAPKATFSLGACCHQR
jgi:hypothetical protein